LFGYSAAEALGQSLDLIIPEHLRASHWRGFEAAMASGLMRLEGRPTLTRAKHHGCAGLGKRTSNGPAAVVLSDRTVETNQQRCPCSHGKSYVR
jgi:hypothetical protein